MRRIAQGLHGSRAIVAVLAVVWLSAVAMPYPTMRPGCDRMPAHQTDPVPRSHDCCVRSAEPAVVDAPTSGERAPAATVSYAVTTAATDTVRPACGLAPVTHGPPLYLRLRVLLA